MSRRLRFITSEMRRPARYISTRINSFRTRSSGFTFSSWRAATSSASASEGRTTFGRTILATAVPLYEEQQGFHVCAARVRRPALQVVALPSLFELLTYALRGTEDVHAFEVRSRKWV